jgi:hypothetical protein
MEVTWQKTCHIYYLPFKWNSPSHQAQLNSNQTTSCHWLQFQQIFDCPDQASGYSTSIQQSVKLHRKLALDSLRHSSGQCTLPLYGNKMLPLQNLGKKLSRGYWTTWMLRNTPVKGGHSSRSYNYFKKMGGSSQTDRQYCKWSYKKKKG